MESAGQWRIGIHPVESPGGPVGIKEAMCVNKAQVLWSIVSRAACGNGRGNQAVNLLLAVAKQTENNTRAAGWV